MADRDRRRGGRRSSPVAGVLLGVLSAGMLALGVLALAGCATGPDDEMVPRPTELHTVAGRDAGPLPRLPHGTIGWRPGVPLSVEGSTIGFGDLRADVSPLRVDHAVATKGGLFFGNGDELWWTTGSKARSTGFLLVEEVVVSANGRYLGLVDRTHGAAQGDQPPVAAAVVYDTTDGRVRLRSTAGMGEVGEDLRTAYAGTPPRALGFDRGALLVRTPAGVYRYPLHGGSPTPITGG